MRPLLLLALLKLVTVSGASASTLDFNRDVRPILFNNCVACHGPDDSHREADLRLDQFEHATADEAIVPGKKEESEIWVRMNDAEDPMPPVTTGHNLTPAQIKIMGQWIDSGAEYDTHWSFKKPVRNKLPQVSDPNWPTNPIDHFILSRLDEKKLKPSPLSDPYSLIRRVSLDLTGLPPTPTEADTFAKDPSPAAYEKLVDKLLAAPAYGERWTRMWLDLARYADSRGYGSDPLRVIWRYRDWVIEAFNKNMPYDQFTREQLAGDLLPNATTEQILATAFHRNTLTNTLGGTIDEEFRVIAVKDRTNTTGQVWMGLTVGCAQCHTHKFDPITHEEYYSLYSIFNQTEDNDLPSEAPRIPTPSPQEEAHKKSLEAQIAKARADLEKRTPGFIQRQRQWEATSGTESSWVTLQPSNLKTTSKVTLKANAEGTITATGEPAKADTYTLTFPNSAKNITALRIDAIPIEGQAENFVINEIDLAVKSNKSGSKQARYIRIELPGKKKMLNLAEVEVFSDGKNIASSGNATQSSTAFGGNVSFSIDGNTDGKFENNSVSHTAIESDPWWELDLGEEKPVEKVSIYSRTDNNLFTRHNGFKIVALDQNHKPVWDRTIAKAKAKIDLSLDGDSSVPLKNASATFAQNLFPASAAIDGELDKNSGWAVAPNQVSPNSIAFEIDRFIGQTDTSLILTLKQTYPEHPLRRFRVSATIAPNPQPLLPRKLAAAIAVAPPKRSAAQEQLISEHFRAIDPLTKDKFAEIAMMEKDVKALKFVSTPIMRDLPQSKHRENYLMIKGNYLQKGKAVTPGVPAAFHPIGTETPDRLALAEWILDPANPLTPRVAANRFWAQLFGTGIVETEEDFGTQGTFPSHPQLLDWLALHFRDDLNWDTKALLKTIVMSSTYRQSNHVTEEHLEKDPKNRLLARGPRFRLEAEMVRDQALSVAGLLSKKMYGSSTFPPQPAGLWRAAFNGERKWTTSQGEDRYRRGLYTFLRRSTPYPSMITFDAPNREICTVRRIPTNTPLQAFVTLNDPAYVEISQALARRIITEGGKDVASRIHYGLKLCLLREPAPEQLAALKKLYLSELNHYQSASPEAEKLATDPLGSLPKDFPATTAETAAWTVVANVLLNIDGMMMK